MRLMFVDLSSSINSGQALSNGIRIYETALAYSSSSRETKSFNFLLPPLFWISILIFCLNRLFNRDVEHNKNVFSIFRHYSKRTRGVGNITCPLFFRSFGERETGSSILAAVDLCHISQFTERLWRVLFIEHC